MKATIVALALLGASGGRPASAAPDAKSKPALTTWSPVVDGVRGRLVATAVPGPAGKPQLELAIELENVSDRAAPIEIAWGNFDPMLQLELVDDAGTVQPKDAIGGNSLSGPPFWLALPVASTLHVTITPSAYEYVPSGKTLLRPMSLVAWELPAKHGPLYLRGVLSPTTEPLGKGGHHPWPGPLVLPRVALP